MKRYGLLLLAMVIVSGCPDGQVSTRQVTEVRSSSNQTDEGYFAYYGFHDGDWRIIKRAGLSFKGDHSAPQYSVPVNGGFDYELRRTGFDVQHNESSFTTGANGVCRVNGVRDKWDKKTVPYWYTLNSSTTLSHPINTARNGCFTYSTNAAENNHGAWAHADRGMTQDDIEYIIASASLPDEEQALSSFTTSGPPAFGVEKVSTTLAQQAGINGIENVVALDGICPNFALDQSHYFKNECPQFYSVIFKTASPVQFTENDVFEVSLHSGASDGVPVDFHCYGSSADGMTHVFRTGLFVTVETGTPCAAMPDIDVYDKWTPFDNEPNLWDDEQYAKYINDDWLSCVDPNLYSDPNIVPDPNCFYDPVCECMHTFVSRLDTMHPLFEDVLIPERIRTLPVVPMNSNDTLYYDFDEKQWRILFKAIDDGWLTDKTVYDVNNDGIINLMDLL
jgi:hypothetical protein